MKKCSLITEISLEDFLKLNLTAYEHRKHFYDENGKEIKYEETGEWVKDSKGNQHWVSFSGVHSRLIWDKISLNDVVLENVEFSKKSCFKNRCICVAIHTEPDPKDIKLEYNKIKHNNPNCLWTLEDIQNKFMFEYSYLDKWLTRAGNQTYLIRCDVPHLYSEKRKFVTHDDYFEVSKTETKAIYLIRY